MAPAAVFLPQDGHFVATELARGPWDPGALHGGAPAALLMRAFEQLPAADGLVIARVTYEFVRPAPVGPLFVEAQVLRPGRRVQLLEASLLTAEGVEVSRARCLQIRAVEPGIPTTESVAAPSGPAHGYDGKLKPPHRPMFTPDAIEIRFISGGWHTGGPAMAWFRLLVPTVAGEEPSPLQRLAAAGDFGNGISGPLTWHDHLYINPDLTLYIDRPPVGEWIGLESDTVIAGAGGVGIAESVLYDERGRVGRAIQALLVAAR